jgi:subtilisin family serine protease
MKKLLFLFFAMLLCVSGFAQAVIDPVLGEEMNRHNDAEQIKVIVIMKSQYDRTQLNRRANYFATRAERREFVVNELKDFAAASQYDLRRSLTEMERNGLVTEPTVLWMANALYFDATKAAIQDLARRNDIEIIGFAMEHNWIPDGEEPQPASATREITQNIIKVGANQVWELGYMGEGVVVAVIDTGVNYNHVDLADHLWEGGSDFPNHGYDVFNHDNDPMDDQGHGSHCAGTVCGDGSGPSQTGMAPDATLMCVKCLGSDGNGGAQNISAGIQWAVEHGCDMFSMSLGIPNSSISERTLLRNTCVAALDAGVVAAIAAGNEGDSQGQYPIPNNVRVPGSCPPPYMDDIQGENPGDLSCSVCIGAVDYNDAAAYFTSHGPVTWTNTTFGDYPYNPGIGLIRPDVCAPGVNIKSIDYSTNSGYTDMSGTSMATPCAAGCMALMLSKDINLMPADVCRILEETAVPLSSGKSNIYGFGRINVLAAVEAIQLGAIKYNAFEINDPTGNNNHKLNPGESVTMSLTLDNVSDEVVSNVTIVLSTDNPNVTITDNEAQFPSFAANQTLTVENAFAFSVNNQVVAKQKIKFNAQVMVNGEPLSRFPINVTVYNPLLQFGAYAILNDSDNDGLLNPGETADLRIMVDNAGNELAQMVVGTLSTDYNYITLNETEKSFSTIGANLMGYADYSVTLAPDTPEGFVIPLTLTLVDANGRATELTFNYKNACNVIFSLHAYFGFGWHGNSLSVSYSDGTPSEQMSISNGSSATYTRELNSGSTITLRWNNGQWPQDCSFEVMYEDGTIIYQNEGGFSGTQTFTINCAGGSGTTEFCAPIRNLAYEVDGHDVLLTWDMPENGTPTTYEVYRETVLLASTTELAYTDADLTEGVYNYCVYAVYNGCQSEFVCTEAEVTFCSGVQNLSYTVFDEDETDDEVTLSLGWGMPTYNTGLIGYEIYKDGELVGSTEELSYTIVVGPGQYDFVVKAVFETCESDKHISACIIGAVENLDYSLDGHTATLTWDAIEGVSQYAVSIVGEPVIVDGTSYTADFEIGSKTVYVEAVADGCYAIRASVDVCVVDPVTELAFVVMDEAGLLHFTWNHFWSVESYEVTYNGITTEVASDWPNMEEFSFEPVVGENSLCVRAKSIFDCYSDPVCITQNVCAAVDGFDYTFNGDEITMTWNGGADSFVISIDGGESTTVETNAYTTIIVGGHNIQVAPLYEDCVALAASFDFVVTNIAPEIRFTDVREGVMATAWNAVDGAIAYNLYRDGELIAENLTETSYNDTEMAINAQHCYAVQSVFEKGVSDKSAEVCANYFAGIGENDSKVSIFPNPTSDKVTIQCIGMSLIEVYTAEGKLVQRIQPEDDTYQLVGLESGVYMLRIRKGDETFVRRVVKM